MFEEQWESSSGEEQVSRGDMTEEQTENKPSLYVFITGCINNPGVYELPEDARVYELVELAGGFTPEADSGYLNLAAYLSDGEKIIVYSAAETATMPSASDSLPDSDTGNGAEGNRGLINLNTAGKEALMTLPGIGEAKAEGIIKYREENGKFSSVEDVMNISGIKEGAYEKIKDLITV